MDTKKKNIKKLEISGYHDFALSQPESFEFLKRVSDGEKYPYFKYIQLVISGFNPEIILDFAAGTCWTSCILSKKYKVVAMEMNNSNVCGIGYHRSHKSPFQIVQGDCEQSPFKQGFDMVFCSQALHHATSLDRMVLEMSKALKPGGIFIACGEHIRPLFSSNNNFKKKHPAVKYGANENAYPWYKYYNAFRKAGLKVKIVPRGNCDFETIKQKSIRKVFQIMKRLRLNWLIDFILLNFSGAGTEVTIIGKS